MEFLLRLGNVLRLSGSMGLSLLCRDTSVNSGGLTALRPSLPLTFQPPAGMASEGLDLNAAVQGGGQQRRGYRTCLLIRATLASDIEGILLLWLLHF